MGNQDNLKNVFKKIQKKFVENLKAYSPLLVDLKAQLKQNPDLDHLKHLLIETHKVAGSAKTFHFSELSKLASSLEENLEKIVKNKVSLEVLEEPLATIIQEIKKIFEETSNSSERSESSEEENEVKEQQKEEIKFKILVADDDELVRNLLDFGLQKQQCKIIEAEDGQKVIDYIEQDSAENFPDLIILDINMPKKNGFEVLKELKNNEKWKAVPVMMLTRRDEGESILKGISTGAIDYINKPFKVPELVERILNVLNLQKTKVLIADDDELICDLLMQRFKRMGYSTKAVHNGIEALAQMKEYNPNLVILDIIMPGMDGLTVLKQAQSDSNLKKIPVILLTAKVQQENLLKGLESGAHDYITKPFDVDEVAARVSGVLQEKVIPNYLLMIIFSSSFLAAAPVAKNKTSSSALENPRYRLDFGYQRSKIIRVPQTDWHRSFVTLGYKGTKRHTLVFSLYHEKRGEITNRAYEAGLYYLMNEAVNGFIKGAYSPNYSFLPELKLQAHGSFRLVSLMDKIFESRFILHSQYDEYFDNIEVGKLVPGLEILLFKKLKIHGEYIRIFDNTKKKLEGWLGKLSWINFIDGVSMFAGSSHAPETVSGVSVRTMAYFGGLEYEPHNQVLLRGSYAREDRENSYIRNIISFSFAVKL